MADVTERMLRLLATLQGGGAFSGEGLASRLEVSPRTLRRDMERLRGYGYPVITRPGPGGYYRLAAGQRLPPLVLDDDEAVAAVAGLAVLAGGTPSIPGGLSDAARRAYGKIDAVLPVRLRSKAAAVRATLESETRARPDVAAGSLGSLAEAIAEQAVVTFDYVNARGHASRRRVEPYRQVHLDSHWYVLCWDRDRNDWRVFRTDRISALARTGAYQHRRELPADTAIEFFRSDFGRRPSTGRG